MVLNRIPGPMLEPSLSSTNHRCLDSCLSHLEYSSNNGEGKWRQEGVTLVELSLDVPRISSCQYHDVDREQKHHQECKSTVYH